MDQICTTDIFRATYHLTKQNRFFEVGLNDGGEKSFTIKGEGLWCDDIRYCTGKSTVNPLVFKETYRVLEEISNKFLSLSDPYLLSSEIDPMEVSDDIEFNENDLFKDLEDEPFEEV